MPSRNHYTRNSPPYSTTWTALLAATSLGAVRSGSKIFKHAVSISIFNCAYSIVGSCYIYVDVIIVSSYGCYYYSFNYC